MSRPATPAEEPGPDTRQVMLTWLSRPNPAVGAKFKNIFEAVIFELRHREPQVSLEEAVKAMAMSAGRIIEVEQGLPVGSMVKTAMRLITAATTAEERINIVVNMATRLPDAEIFGEDIVCRVSTGIRATSIQGQGRESSAPSGRSASLANVDAAVFAQDLAAATKAAYVATLDWKHVAAQAGWHRASIERASLFPENPEAHGTFQELQAMLLDAGQHSPSPAVIAEMTVLFGVAEAIAKNDRDRAASLVTDRLQQICWRLKGDIDAAANGTIDTARVLESFLDDRQRLKPLTKAVLQSQEPPALYKVKANLVGPNNKINIMPKFLGGGVLKPTHSSSPSFNSTPKPYVTGGAGKRGSPAAGSGPEADNHSSVGNRNVVVNPLLAQCEEGAFVATTVVDRLLDGMPKPGDVMVSGPTVAAHLMRRFADKQRWTARDRASWRAKLAAARVWVVVIHNVDHYYTIAVDLPQRSVVARDSSPEHRAADREAQTRQWCAMLADVTGSVFVASTAPVPRQREAECALCALSSAYSVANGTEYVQLTRSDLRRALLDPQVNIFSSPAHICRARATGQGKNRPRRAAVKPGQEYCPYHCSRVQTAPIGPAAPCARRTAANRRCPHPAVTMSAQGEPLCAWHGEQDERRATDGPQRTRTVRHLGAVPLNDEDPDSGLREGEEPPRALRHPQQDFQVGVGAPHAAYLTRCHLTKLSTATAENGPKLAREGLSKETRDSHAAMLRALARAAGSIGWSALGPDWPAADFIVRWLDYLRKVKKWRWSTMRTKMACIAGAFAHLPLYAPSFPTRVSLTETPVWTNACRRADLKAATEIPVQAPPVQKKDIVRVCETAASPEDAAYAALMWITAARPGCISQLKTEDIVWDTERDELAVTFRRGKGVQLRSQPYSVHTNTGIFKPFVRRVLENRDQASWVFECPRRQDRKQLSARCLEGLRRINGQYTNKSVRRGALQAMARAGVPTTTLLHFSGHTNIPMLKRYLGFGTLLAEEARKVRGDAANLLTGGL